VPTYQYSCNDCGHFHEIFQSFSDDSLTVCPECGGRLRKVFNAVGVVFKGSGFYRNDSRGQKVGAETGPETGAQSKGESKGESKGDTKAGANGSGKGAETAGSTSKSEPSTGGSSGTTAPAPA